MFSLVSHYWHFNWWKHFHHVYSFSCVLSGYIGILWWRLSTACLILNLLILCLFFTCVEELRAKTSALSSPWGCCESCDHWRPLNVYQNWRYIFGCSPLIQPSRLGKYIYVYIYKMHLYISERHLWCYMIQNQGRWYGSETFFVMLVESLFTSQKQSLGCVV